MYICASVHVYMSDLIYVRLYELVRICIYTHVSAFVCEHIRMNVCINVLMYLSMTVQSVQDDVCVCFCFIITSHLAIFCINFLKYCVFVRILKTYFTFKRFFL